MAELNDLQSEALLRLVVDTADEEIVCETFRRDVAAYLAAYQASLEEQRPLPPRLQRVAQHRRACPECDEEFELLADLEADDEHTGPRSQP